MALDILTREGQTEGYVDIFGCVLSLRGQRVDMVQNVDQYRYLHHAIEHSLTTNCEQIENGNFCRVSADQIDEGFNDTGMYVPDGDKELTTGKFKVKVTNSESTPEYELRYITINVQGTGADEVKTIPHYQFTDWPANSPVPASVDSFLDLIRDTDRIVRDSGNEKGPVLVHCLTGAERCGLIPVIANLFEKLEAEQQASVVNVTRQIRARRARAIPNKEQFQFSYSCVKQFVENSSVYANVL